MPRKFLRRFLPNANKVKHYRLLAWMGSSLHHPSLWHVSREGIARGAAIGLFFGFLVPVGQIPLAAAFAFVLHANLPMAVVATFVTNTLTLAPIYYFAYHLGLFITGGDQAAAPIDLESFDANRNQAVGWFASWSDYLMRLGKPLMFGLFVLASSSATMSYFGISWLWRVLTLRERRRGWRRKYPNNTPP